MSNKALINLYVPTLGESYDLFIPVNEIIGREGIKYGIY